VVSLSQVPLPKKLLFLPFLFTTLAPAQSSPSANAPQLSPQAAYDQAMHPLEITRSAISNWSDAELNALAIAVKQATEACGARMPEQFSGDDLVAYARLCALGQQWPTVITAADRYITSADPAKPLLAQAYAFKINATLHTNDVKAMLADSEAMLQAVPYTSLTDETLYGALHYLQLAFTPEALTLYAARQPVLLAALRAPQPPPQAQATTGSSVPIHTLYFDGLAFAALQQFSGDPATAGKTVAELDAALPATLSPDESIPIAETRRQYALLGTHLPAIPLTVSLFSVGETPHINTNYGDSTVLFLFPEWCAQCIRLTKQILPTLYRINGGDGYDVHLYALLAQTAPPVAAPPTTPPKPAPAKSRSVTNASAPPEAPKTTAEQLRGTPTLIVPPATISLFAATDFPLLIATDPKGIIRFIQPAGETALNPGDFLDQILMHITKQWPRQTAPAKASPSASPNPIH
jgi:hypothetical protein